ncbi:hypothetical protein HH212_06500 [Massilia forsythiae]|uniref:Aerotolerance regulator N-terminal domain-containing protein n=1 Tax=Massilia forsythiae TaxID=2728020 RepID=A0A7Z2VUZ0_9BURK|nr:BatA domain-containing protein [Massilia forsythiae]QJD99720.1 hypothetical protein HH212_06500 [Massilia forsythiae]
MNASWWWALPVLLLPVLWHRRKREQDRMALLATARFLPAAQPRQLRSWRLDDLPLLLLRCLLLLALVALLADPVPAWRGDTVLVVPGGAANGMAGFAQARRVALPDRDAAAWLHAHEREFKPDARVLVVGEVAMPATLPRFRRQVELRPQQVVQQIVQPDAQAGRADTPQTPARTAAPAATAIHVAVYSARATDWRRLFAAAGGAHRYVVDEGAASASPAASGRHAGAQAAADLIVWELPQAPPPGLRAPLWWVSDTAGNAPVFPELAKAATLGALRYADSARGRLWSMDAWPLADAGGARTLLERYARLHLAPPPFTAPPQLLRADAAAPAGISANAASGALRTMLALALVVLFALERMATHVRRR